MNQEISLQVILVIFSPIIVMLLIIIPWFISTNQRSKEFKEFIQSIGGEIINEFSGSVFFENKKYFLQYCESSTNQFSSFSVSADKISPSSLTIRKEKKSDQVFKNIGLNQEVQIQEPDFNDSIYLDGENESFIRQLFNKEETRQAAKRLANQFSTIEFQPSGCFLRKSPFKSIRFLTLPGWSETIKDFSVLIAAVPATATPQLSNQNNNFNLESNLNVNIQAVGRLFSGGLTTRQSFLTIFGVAGVIFIVGMVLFIIGMGSVQLTNPWGIWLNVLVISLVPVAILLKWIFQKVKGYPDSSKIFGLCGGFIIFGCVFTVIGATVFLNSFEDKSPLIIRECLVTRKHISRDRKYGDSYKIYVSPWNSNQRSYEFAVSRNEYQAVIPDQTTYQILTKKGNFGFEWITSRQKLN